MFSLPPPPGEGPEGASDEGPIVLEGVKLGDFERFLSVLYPKYAIKRPSHPVC